MSHASAPSSSVQTFPSAATSPGASLAASSGASPTVASAPAAPPVAASPTSASGVPPLPPPPSETPPLPAAPSAPGGGASSPLLLHAKRVKETSETATKLNERIGDLVISKGSTGFGGNRLGNADAVPSG